MGAEKGWLFWAAHFGVFPGVLHDLGAGHGGRMRRRREVMENYSKEWKL